MTTNASRPPRMTGDESFRQRAEPLGFDLRDFWSWAWSDLASNTLRGVLAEYLVARALGVELDARVEWDACDMTTPEGWRVEVKSAAYVQSWHQSRPSTIRFDIGKKAGWHAETNAYDAAPCRGSDVYGFCLLKHQDKATLDPLDLDQWEFYVVPTRVLDERLPTQKSIGLATLKRLGASAVAFGALREAVAAAAAEHARPRQGCPALP